jgi:hypothetical protein
MYLYKTGFTIITRDCGQRILKNKTKQNKTKQTNKQKNKQKTKHIA